MQHIDLWYKSYKGRLLALACQRGHPLEEAKDIVHQFFLDMLQKEISDIKNPEAFLLTAFKNKLIDLYRAKHKGEAVDSINIPAPSILEIIEEIESNEELINRIAIAFKKLPARYRRVIYLKYYKGLTTEKIVLVTGFTHQTVYNNLSKGIRLLRQNLKQKNRLSHLAGVLFSLF